MQALSVIYDSFGVFGFNRYAYCMYNPLKYVDPSGEQYLGWNGGSTYYLEEAYRDLMRTRYYQYLELMQQTSDHINALINGLCLEGDSGFGSQRGRHGNGGGHHGSGIGGGGSVEVQSIGDGKYKVVNGLHDGGNTVYVVDDQGNRTGEILGYTLTTWTFYKANGNVVSGAIIDFNDYSGQKFLDGFVTNPPDIFTYKKDIINGDNGTDISLYSFKVIGYDADNDDYEMYIYRSMPINFGDGLYIATARDIGNFAAGYLCGINGFTYSQTRIFFDGYQLKRYHNVEPHVSQLAQDRGYYWGNQFFSRTIQIPFYY